jgi:hypothetical protein
MLYYYIGKLLNDKIMQHSWGDKVLAQIATDLKKQMPNLRGFSARNLKNMRQFYTAYEHNSIGQLLTAQLQSTQAAEDWLSTTTQTDNSFLSNFFSVTFTHHLIMLNKCNILEERMF